MLHKLFRVAFGVHWQQHLTIRELCKVTEKIRRGRLRFAGHCYRHKDEMASKTILW